MSVQVQESLLDVCDESVLGALGGSVRRARLDRGAWVDLRRSWLTGSGPVFERLSERAGLVPWRGGKRHMYDKGGGGPRLLCFFHAEARGPRPPSSAREDAPLPAPVLPAAREPLTAHSGRELGEPFRTAGLCLYRD